MPSPRRPIAALLTTACLAVGATGVAACGSDDAKRTGDPVGNDTGNLNTPGSPGGTDRSTDGTSDQTPVPTTSSSGTTVAPGQPRTGTGNG